MSGVLQNIDRYEVVFDDEGLPGSLADAGLLAKPAGDVDSAAGIGLEEYWWIGRCGCWAVGSWWWTVRLGASGS